MFSSAQYAHLLPFQPSGLSRQTTKVHIIGATGQIYHSDPPTPIHQTPPRTVVSPRCPIMAALYGTGPSRGGTGGRSRLGWWRRLEWGSECSGSETGRERKLTAGRQRERERARAVEKHPGECDPLLHWDATRVYTPRRDFRGAPAVHLTRGGRRKRGKKEGARLNYTHRGGADCALVPMVAAAEAARSAR